MKKTFSVNCCDKFDQISSVFNWFSYNDDNGEKVFVMPNIDLIRVNNCPVCGAEVRNIQMKIKQ